MKKRGHHYVWQHYLKSWSNHSQLYCLRNKKVFHSNTKNVGKKRDFYKLKNLSKKEIHLLKLLIKELSQNGLKEVHDGWLDIFVTFSEFQENLGSITELEETFYNTEENFMSKIETDAVKYLEFIRNKNIEFQKDDTEYTGFLFFLSIQYFRTNRMQTNMNKIEYGSEINPKNIWSVLKYLVATNMAHSLFSRKEYKIVLIVNDSDEDLITGDQPVINTLAAGSYDKEVFNSELYYPISPKLAILITDKHDYEVKYIEAKDVKFYNLAIYKHSHEQIYAASKESLDTMISTHK